MTLDEIARTLERIEKEVHTIKRGVYGDEANKVRGLIATDIEQHGRIRKLEDFKKKAVWVLTGAVIVIELLIHVVK